MSIINRTLTIRAPAKSYYNIFKSQMYLLPTIAPSLVQKIEVLQGDWVSVGSVIKWYYTLALGLVQLTATETKDSTDDTNLSVAYTVFDGDLIKLYKTFKISLQVTPTAAGGGSVTWTIEFELLGVTVPVPTAYLDFAEAITAAIDTYLLSH